MKKKLIPVLAVAMSVALASCSSEKVEEGKKKVRKNIEDDIDKISSAFDSYVDDETDLSLTTDAPSDTTPQDTTPTTTADESVKDTQVSDSTAATAPADFSPDFTFTIYDMAGNAYDESIFAEHQVTMINFWEPWCGPCVAEMPELEKLYEDYKDKGLLIIGVFSSTDTLDDVNKVLNDAKITYPILIYDSVFDQFQTGYVPTTIFVDQNGHIIPESNGYGDNVVVGSASYDDWAAIVTKYLK